VTLVVPKQQLCSYLNLSQTASGEAREGTVRKRLTAPLPTTAGMVSSLVACPVDKVHGSARVGTSSGAYTRLSDLAEDQEFEIGI